PYAAGGTIDSMARLLSPKFQAELGQPVLIDNRPGAGTMIGADAVARSEPDGHTLFMGTNSAFTISPHIMDKLPYDPLRSFAAIGTMATLPNLIVVKPDAPYQTLADVVDAARRGEKISYASFGKGSTAHLSGEAIRVAAAIDIGSVHPPLTEAQTTDQAQAMPRCLIHIKRSPQRHRTVGSHFELYLHERHRPP
ncbi:hypothetical protein ET532_024580, partial [Verminephrobacter sp. Larva24]